MSLIGNRIDVGWVFLAAVAWLLCACNSSAAQDQAAGNSVVVHNLDQCLELALKNNRTRNVSGAAIKIAEAQYKQAQSNYWPQLNSTVSALRLEDDPGIQYPSRSFNLPGVPIPITIPSFEVKLLDRDLVGGGVALTYPLFTGGKISSVAKQANIGVQAARESARKTDLQVVYDVTRMYYGVILAKNLRQLGSDTRERLEATRDLTGHMYQASSGKVKKTDFLRAKIICSNASSLLAMLASNEDLAKAALINSMGLDWNTEIEVVENELPHREYTAGLDNLIADSYQFSPDWSRINLGLDAAEAKIKEAKSGYYPKLAFVGSLSHLNETYDSGLMTGKNRDNWQVGLVMTLPLFHGFRTVNEVRETRARMEKLTAEKFLLSEGIALQVKDTFLQIMRAESQIEALGESLEAAAENRELNVRAYQQEMVETRDVIEAQLLESFVRAQYLKAVYDSMENQAELDFVIGRELDRLVR